MDGVPGDFFSFITKRGASERVANLLAKEPLAGEMLNRFPAETVKGWAEDLFQRNQVPAAEANTGFLALQAFLQEQGRPPETPELPEPGLNGDAPALVSAQTLATQLSLLRFRPEFIERDGRLILDPEVVPLERQTQALDEDSRANWFLALARRYAPELREALSQVEPKPISCGKVDSVVDSIFQRMESADLTETLVVNEIGRYRQELLGARNISEALTPPEFASRHVLPLLRSWGEMLLGMHASFEAVNRYDKTDNQKQNLGDLWFRLTAASDQFQGWASTAPDAGLMGELQQEWSRRFPPTQNWKEPGHTRRRE